MIKVLFFLPTLGSGGAERVLVNLVNNIDPTRFDVTVKTLFDIGSNRALLSPKVKYEACMTRVPKGIMHLMKFASRKFLHRLFIKKAYDLEISYLEGMSTRIISGCDNPRTKLIAWVHTEFVDKKFAAYAYRNFAEAARCYERYDKVVCVSEEVRRRFGELFYSSSKKAVVNYNTNDAELIRTLAKSPVEENLFSGEEFKIIAVGKINANKGFDRLARALKRLFSEGLRPHFYVVGEGEERGKLEEFLTKEALNANFTFLGFHKNPYRFVKRCDLFICSSYREGFSTAVTEALILGVPVLTVDVSGMRELLGKRNEYGVVVPNDEESLYLGIKEFLTNPMLSLKYKKLAEERGRFFSKDVTVAETEKLLKEVVGKGEEEGC